MISVSVQSSTNLCRSSSSDFRSSISDRNTYGPISSLWHSSIWTEPIGKRVSPILTRCWRSIGNEWRQRRIISKTPKVASFFVTVGWSTWSRGLRGLCVVTVYENNSDRLPLIQSHVPRNCVWYRLQSSALCITHGTTLLAPNCFASSLCPIASSHQLVHMFISILVSLFSAWLYLLAK